MFDGRTGNRLSSNAVVKSLSINCTEKNESGKVLLGVVVVVVVGGGGAVCVCECVCVGGGRGGVG